MKLILPLCEINYEELPEKLPVSQNTDLSALFDFIREWFNSKDYILVKTSGSTGTPKKLQLKKKYLKNSASATYKYFEPWNSKPLLMALPARYIAGKMMVVRALEYGLPLIWIEPDSNPLPRLKVPVQFAALVPNQVSAGLQLLHAQKIEKLIIGGAPVTPELERKLQTVSTRCYATYGMTETATHIALRPLNGPERTNAFTFLKGISGSRNHKNELTIHAPHLGHQNLQTHDIVALNQNEFIWRGRSNFTINSGGLKIQPEELEKKLEGKIPFAFYFWSEPDPVLGEKPVLVLECEASPARKKEILKLLSANLPDKKLRPKNIYFTPRFSYSNNKKLLRKQTFKTCHTLKEQ